MALNERAVLEAMRGRVAEARSLLAAAEAAATEREETIWRAGGWMASWEVETLAGDAAAAETAARRTCNFLEELGETAFRSLAAAQLASSLYKLGRFDSAERWTQTAEELASSDDVTPNMLWRQIRAKLLARNRRFDEAERLARDAVGLGEETDMLNWRGHALSDLAEVYVLAGRREDGVEQLEQALALYERKGNLASAGNVESMLAELRQNRLLVTERTIQ
jgi:tetratricopeptide (TPR) repeat protein